MYFFVDPSTSRQLRTLAYADCYGLILLLRQRTMQAMQPAHLNDGTSRVAGPQAERPTSLRFIVVRALGLELEKSSFSHGKPLYATTP
jgi:hypothetical protein